MSRESQMQSEMLDLVGGSGERPTSPNDPPPEVKGFIVTTQHVAQMSDSELEAWRCDQIEFGERSTGNLRVIETEIRRRAKLAETWRVLR